MFCLHVFVHVWPLRRAEEFVNSPGRCRHTDSLWAVTWVLATESWPSEEQPVLFNQWMAHLSNPHKDSLWSSQIPLGWLDQELPESHLAPPPQCRDYRQMYQCSTFYTRSADLNSGHTPAGQALYQLSHLPGPNPAFISKQKYQNHVCVHTHMRNF